MENRIRKQVLGLYTGQPRKKTDEYSGNDECVLIKPLDWITVNDVYDFTQILLISHMDNFEDQKQFIIQLYDERQATQWDLGYTAFDYLRASDLLRERGYAIPAFGYTVEQLLKENIFKYLVMDNDITPETPDQKVQAGDMKRKGNRSKGLGDLLK